MAVEELDLCDGGCADEASFDVELWADFHAAGAGDAVGERVAYFLFLREHTRAGAEIVGAIDGDPGFNGLEIFKEDGAINLQVANERKLGERLDLDGLLEVVDEGGASHA